MGIKAVLWDIDGTLVDSEPLHLKALLAVCMQYNADISDLPDDTFIGVNLNGVWDALKRRFPAELTRGVWTKAIDDHYVRQSETLHAMPGAIETIKSLHGLGIRQAAVSNSGRKVVDTNLEFLRTNGIFEFSISLDDVSEAKPDPEPYLQAMSKMEIEPSQALAIEDSHSGAKSAKAAGLTLVAYNNPGLPADVWIDDLKDLPSHLSNHRQT
ncbi:HAD family phosphatase [Pararhizobium sp. IMCC21322]|uniref:HAD family hydrolase n=1 Tax=Pararhizobium sp. IMCC21322 TaxID=3067903 RepID=UPI002740EF80|nr:HAD family phosphatase [Pararhizobium sp. IMCC21322]